MAGRVGGVGPAVAVVAQGALVLGSWVVLGGDGMVQTLHAAPGAVLVRTLPQVRPGVKAAGQVRGRGAEGHGWTWTDCESQSY